MVWDPSLNPLTVSNLVQSGEKNVSECKYLVIMWSIYDLQGKYEGGECKRSVVPVVMKSGGGAELIRSYHSVCIGE